MRCIHTSLQTSHSIRALFVRLVDTTANKQQYQSLKVFNLHLVCTSCRQGCEWVTLPVKFDLHKMSCLYDYKWDSKRVALPISLCSPFVLTVDEFADEQHWIPSKYISFVEDADEVANEQCWKTSISSILISFVRAILNLWIFFEKQIQPLT